LQIRTRTRMGAPYHPHQELADEIGGRNRFSDPPLLQRIVDAIRGRKLRGMHRDHPIHGYHDAERGRDQVAFFRCRLKIGKLKSRHDRGIHDIKKRTARRHGQQCRRDIRQTGGLKVFRRLGKLSVISVKPLEVIEGNRRSIQDIS